jgi:hypothetical protein
VPHADCIESIFDIGGIDIRTDVPECALRFGAVEVVSPCARRRSIDLVE